jgi:hypothetical protein
MSLLLLLIIFLYSIHQTYILMYMYRFHIYDVGTVYLTNLYMSIWCIYCIYIKRVIIIMYNTNHCAITQEKWQLDTN